MGRKDGRNVAWMTVSEAAEMLEISESAVRKRMQRKTLKHSKLLDGRVHVYVPAKKEAQKGAEQDAVAQRAENSSPHQPHSWLEYVAAGTGVIALLGAMTYGLGLLTLWLPLWRTYTHDGTTAWYAASLVPKTVVAGLGMGQLVASPTLGLIITLAGGAIIVSIGNYTLNRWGRIVTILTMELMLLGLTGLIVWRLTVGFEAFSLEPLNWHTSVKVGIAYFLGIHFLGFLFTAAARVLQRRQRHADSMADHDKSTTSEAPHKSDVTNTSIGGNPRESARRSVGWGYFGPKIPYQMWRWWFFPLFMLVSFYIVAATAITFRNPTLPTVEITGVKDMDGALLTHTEGFWYIFDMKGTNKGKLIALHDDQIETVSLCREAKCQIGNPANSDRGAEKPSAKKGETP